MKILRFFKISIWVIPFILLEIAIITSGIKIFSNQIIPINIPDKWQGALLTINITIGVFAVNFSFSAYQSSPYRTLLGNLSQRHILSATVTLIISLLPLSIIVFNDSWVPTVAFIAIPIVSAASIILSQIAISESNPSRMVQRNASKSCIENFAEEFLVVLKNTSIDPPEIEGKEGMPPPMHEMDWQLIARIPHKDPFTFMRMLSKIAIDQGDIENYDLIIDRVLNSTLELKSYLNSSKSSENYKYIDSIINYSISSINSIGNLTKGKDKQMFAERYLSRITIFINSIEFKTYIDSIFIMNILKCMLPVAEEQLEMDNSDDALIPIIVARQWAARGMKKNLKDGLIDCSFANCATIIQILGMKSIEKRNSNFHYRCLDALGWLGCNAAQVDNYEVGRQCANSLVQLGRIARSKGLECFWSHCALSPFDHALERIEWIVSHTIRLDEDKRKEWSEMLSEAISRLNGKKSKIIYFKEENQWKCKIENSDERHTYTIDDNGRVRTIDYSDVNELKEFKLY